MSSRPNDSEDSIPAPPLVAAIPGDPFPWAPEAAPEHAAAPIDPAPKEPEEPDEELFPRDLGEVD